MSEGSGTSRSAGRVLALDLGEKRIGIAVCDTMRILASPLTVISRGRTHGNDHERILQLVRDEDVSEVVVGLPVDLRGQKAIAAKKVEHEIAELRVVLPVPVHAFDERMTTNVARHILHDRGMPHSRRRDVVDMVAATSILQGWLDRTIETRMR